MLEHGNTHGKSAKTLICFWVTFFSSRSHSKLDVDTSMVEDLEQNELISENETDQNLNKTGIDDIYDDVGWDRKWRICLLLKKIKIIIIFVQILITSLCA